MSKDEFPLPKDRVINSPASPLAARALTRREYLLMTAAGATAAVLPGCGGGSSARQAIGATGNSLSPAERAALRQAISIKWASLPHTDRAADAQTMMTFLKAQASVAQAGISPDLSIWCLTREGQPLGIINNESLSQNYAPSGSTARSTGSSSAGGTRATITIGLPNEELPAPGSAHLFDLFGALENTLFDPRFTTVSLVALFSTKLETIVGLEDILNFSFR